MHFNTCILWILVNVGLSLCTPQATKPKIRPIVIWHGLGDAYNSDGMVEFEDMIKEVHPGIFIHRVYIDKDGGKDVRATFFGNLTEHVEIVAQQLSGIAELQAGFDAIGFSQGGQFLRAYVEKYNSPHVFNLITFGSQHLGISDLPACRTGDFLCLGAYRLFKNGAYSSWSQNNLVQAQYYRDVSHYDTYLSSNLFLTSINNEVPDSRNESYAKQFSSLETLVLVIFDADTTVVPKESGWFGSLAIPDDQDLSQKILASPEEPETIVPMRQQPMYLEDWIGLKELDDRNGIVFDSCPGAHMRLGDCWERLIKRYTGSLMS